MTRYPDHLPGEPPGEHGSPLVRAVFFVLGALAFGAAVLGLFLPLLPATPLFILAAACFARAYRPFHEWMLGHRWLGPILHDWYRHRSLSRRTKIVAIVTMLVSFGLSITLFVEARWMQLVLAAVAVGLAAWLYSIPSRDGAADATGQPGPSASTGDGSGARATTDR
jgi:uncharacterized membrane protein YbaN (DUF454 family)